MVRKFKLLWLALLILPLLGAGFQTDGLIKTDGRIKVSHVTIGSVGGGGGCTDGVDCLCDTISTTSTLLGCEDFERAGYYDAGEAENWTTKETPSSYTCYRGQNAPWVDDFGPTGTANTASGQPSSPRLGCTCSAGGASCQLAGDWCSEAQGNLVDGGGIDCWQKNSGGVPLDIQRAGDFDEEVGTLTLTGGTGDAADVLGGNAHLAHRIAPGSNAGTFGTFYLKSGADHGSSSDNTNATEVGLTMKIAYSSNIGTETDRVIGTGSGSGSEWKHNEWGTDGQSWMEHWNLGNSGCGDVNEFPYRPFLWHDGTPTDDAGPCNSALATSTDGTGSQIGGADCTGAALRLCSTSAFDQATDFPWGTVACHQAHIKGLGTSDVDIEIKHNGTTVIKLENVDGTYLQNSYYSNFIFNAYANRNQTGASTETDVTQYRYEDDIVVVNGPPEPCSSIGF